MQNEGGGEAADGESAPIHQYISIPEIRQRGYENSQNVSSPANSLERPEAKESILNISHDNSNLTQVTVDAVSLRPFQRTKGTAQRIVAA